MFVILEPLPPAVEKPAVEEIVVKIETTNQPTTQLFFHPIVARDTHEPVLILPEPMPTHSADSEEEFAAELSSLLENVISSESDSILESTDGENHSSAEQQPLSISHVPSSISMLVNFFLLIPSLVERERNRTVNLFFFARIRFLRLL